MAALPPVNGLVAYLRQRAAQSSPTPARRGGTAEASAGQASNTGLLKTLPGRIASLRLENGADRSRAVRMVVEAVLLDEFGAQYIDSSEFQELVTQTANAMAQESTLNSTVQATLSHLGIDTKS